MAAYGVAFLVFCQGRISGGRSVNTPTDNFQPETKPRFLTGSMKPQYTRKPLPYLFAQISLQSYGLSLTRSKTKPYGCFQKNLPLSSVFF
jgi:hypothetical protein